MTTEAVSKIRRLSAMNEDDYHELQATQMWVDALNFIMANPAISWNEMVDEFKNLLEQYSSVPQRVVRETFDQMAVVSQGMEPFANELNLAVQLFRDAGIFREEGPNASS